MKNGSRDEKGRVHFLGFRIEKAEEYEQHANFPLLVFPLLPILISSVLNCLIHCNEMSRNFAWRSKPMYLGIAAFLYQNISHIGLLVRELSRY